MMSFCYSANTKLNCGCNAPVIICVSDPLTESGLPFIEGNLVFSESVTNSCGKIVYNYAITYDETQLVDPANPLVGCYVTGVICRGCLTSYIDSSIAHAIAGLTPPISS